MLTQLVVFILGLGILYLGADWLIEGASELAKKFGIRSLIIGLTIIALGTSLPEFLLNLFAVAAEEDGLAIGNIVGSNIANIALILGISAIVMPLSVDGAVLKKEYPIMLAATGLFYLMALDGVISRLDGAILVSGLIAFLVFVIWDASTGEDQTDVTVEAPAPEEDPFGARSGIKKWLDHERLGSAMRILLIIAGMGALAIGARLMVQSAITMAAMLNINPVIVGLSIVAIGTSLPELAASLMASVRQESDLSVGNILGSNLLNILFVVGVVALIEPMQVDSETLNFHMPVMIAFSLLLWPLTRRHQRLGRSGAFIFLSCFLGYLGWLLYPYL